VGKGDAEEGGVGPGDEDVDSTEVHHPEEGGRADGDGGNRRHLDTDQWEIKNRITCPEWRFWNDVVYPRTFGSTFFR